MTFKSWSQWGRERGERSLLREHEDYKLEALEERESMSVFVIINEWTSIDNSTGAEVVGANFFESENEAHEALGNIAEAYDIHLPADETSVQLEDHLPHLQYEEYYIQELTKL